MNRRRQLQQLKKLSALEVGNYIPASECIGKQFSDGQYLYHVAQYHPRKGTFTLEMVNAFNQRIEKPETFVRHHCTPPQPREIIQPPRPEVRRYFPFSAPIISDKTEVGDKMEATAQANTTLEADVIPESTSAVITPSFHNHLVTGDIKNQGEWHRCLVIARELRSKQLWGGVLPLHICGDVSAIHYQLSVHGQLPFMKLVGNQWLVSAAAVMTDNIGGENVADFVAESVAADVQLNTTLAGTDVNKVTAAAAEALAGVQHHTPLDPAYYLDQVFTFTALDGTPYTVRVQGYNAERGQFRLYDPNGTTGSFYRDAAFVYEHCTPAAAPVIREPLPKIEFDPFRYWNLVSLSHKRETIADDVQATGVPQADPLLQCACCGQHLTIIGKQVYPAKYNLKDLILVECRNPDCIVYRWTASSDSHADSCETAKCEALKKEQILYAHERSQFWLAEENRLRESGNGHSKAAHSAGRKAQYWLDQLNKLEGLR